jgi:hypothetical protein
VIACVNSKTHYFHPFLSALRGESATKPIPVRAAASSVRYSKQKHKRAVKKFFFSTDISSQSENTLQNFSAWTDGKGVKSR